MSNSNNKNSNNKNMSDQYSPLLNSRPPSIYQSSNDEDNEDDDFINDRGKNRERLNVEFNTPQKQNQVTVNSRETIMASLERSGSAAQALLNVNRQFAILGCPEGLKHDKELQNHAKKYTRSQVQSLRELILKSNFQDSSDFLRGHIAQGKKSCIFLVGGRVPEIDPDTDNAVAYHALTANQVNRNRITRQRRDGTGTLDCGYVDLEVSPITSKIFEDDVELMGDLAQVLYDSDNKHPLSNVLLVDMNQNIFLRCKVYDDHLGRFVEALQYFENNKTSVTSLPIWLCAGLYLQNSRQQDGFKVLATQDGFALVNGVFLVGEIIPDAESEKGYITRNFPMLESVKNYIAEIDRINLNALVPRLVPPPAAPNAGRGGRFPRIN